MCDLRSSAPNHSSADRGPFSSHNVRLDSERIFENSTFSHRDMNENCCSGEPPRSGDNSLQLGVGVGGGGGGGFR